MKTVSYLTLSKKGVVSTTKSLPSLKSGQVAIRLNIEVPDGVFEPTMVVNLTIKEEDIIHPPVNAELSKDIDADGKGAWDRGMGSSD
jgi:hypothetical protein